MDAKQSLDLLNSLDLVSFSAKGMREIDREAVLSLLNYIASTPSMDKPWIAETEYDSITLWQFVQSKRYRMDTREREALEDFVKLVNETHVD